MTHTNHSPLHRVNTTRPDWADDVSDNDTTALPAPVTTVNKDGTKTTISYRLDEVTGKKIKITRKIRTTIHREKVNPAVAERKGWAKFGLEKGKPRGPQSDTTSVGENIQFRPSRDWKNVAAQEAKEQKEGGGLAKGDERSLKEQLKDKKVKCRICQGEHFTARCPYKDTMAPAEEGGAVADPMAEDEDAAGRAMAAGRGGGGGMGGAEGSSYVPPHMRKGAAASAGDRMGGKFERDDLATLRVTNVSFSIFAPRLHYVDILLIHFSTGIRDGRRARAARHVRALRPRHEGVPGQGQRDTAG